MIANEPITNPGTRRLRCLVDAIDTEMLGGPEPGVSCDPDTAPDQPPPVFRDMPLPPLFPLTGTGTPF